MIAGEDLAAYLTAFGQPVTVGGVAGSAVFDEAYQEAFGIASAGPQLIAAAADFPDAAMNQAVAIGTRTFTVAAPPEPDGTGVIVLRLHKS